ncbi:MAG: hypothetical protein ACREEM_22910 [Blastocatellia bacterium]
MNQQAFNFVLRAACLLCLFCLTGGRAFAQFDAGQSNGNPFAGFFSIDDGFDVRVGNTDTRTAYLASLGVTQACQLRFALINSSEQETVTINDLVIVATVTNSREKNTVSVIIPRFGEGGREVKAAFVSTKLFNIILQPGTGVIPTVKHFMLPLGDAVRLQQLIDDPSIGPRNIRIGFITNQDRRTDTFFRLGVSFYSALGATVSASMVQSGIVNVTARITNTAETLPPDMIPVGNHRPNNAITQTGIEFLSTLPQQLAAVPGSCRATVDGANIGNCAILRGSTIRFSIPFNPQSCGIGESCAGGLAPGKKVIVTYQARIAGGIPHCGSLLIRSATSATCQTVATALRAPDNTPPSVAATVARSSLWPPNNDLNNAGLAVRASDNCTANPAIAVKVYSDEDDVDGGGFSPDARNIAPHTLRLRAERNGNRNGRVYLIVVKATDEAGNAEFDLETVVVPKSQSQADREAVHQQAIRAKAFFRANRMPPPGYFLVGDGPAIGPKQ